MEDLLRLILPEEIFLYFDIISISHTDTEVHIHLDEKNITPEEFKNDSFQSKGFSPEAVIRDFPLRDKSLYLHVRRRKWLNLKDNTIVSNSFDLTAKGTRYSKGFASFLKELFGYLPSKF